MPDSFPTSFEKLTGHAPFPWQVELYKRFIAVDIPSSCNIPTGLGKTSVLAIWLIAHSKKPNLIPRRLVYVVNRRTVVDQTTNEALKIKENAGPLDLVVPSISTLRGQLADNREWSSDPSKAAIICGTVDMIGSRLLFSGYGIGVKARPLHAGFLGQDVLLVHDEAHLEPAFQELLTAIEKEQQRCKEFKNFRVMELTATSRGLHAPFTLTAADLADKRVKDRYEAKKTIKLHPSNPSKKLADQIADLALKYKDSNRPILVFVRTVEDVMKIRERLAKEKLSVETLTGTLRGKERDGLVENPIFQRFLPKTESGAENGNMETAYLVCTSAGEVGVNISADHLVCDLSTFESMAQRFGRVNRFGNCSDTIIDVVYPIEFDPKKPFETKCQKTLELLNQLKEKGSPEALASLPEEQRLAAFAPPPTTLPVSDILFDAWALTTIKEKLPGRPPVEPYLHGITEWEPPQTHVAWREEVGAITGEMLATFKPESLLEDYPLKPYELLREPSDRAFKHFGKIAERHPSAPVWLLNHDGGIEVITTSDLADKESKNQIWGKTVLLPPSAGGLKGGLLDGASEAADDVADTPGDRTRIWADDPEFETKTREMRSIREIVFGEDDDGSGGKSWCWFEVASEGGKSSKKPVLWDVHVDDVVKHTQNIVKALPLDSAIRDAIVFAARYHDHGKRRKLFQTVLGNSDPGIVLAKSGGRGSRLSEIYRHEFGSLLDVQNSSDFKNLPPNIQQLVLHLIAAHHGRARPHFPPGEDFDPESSITDAENMAMATPRRFALLQRKFGRWGLAYIESLLRAADWAASANPSAFVGGTK